MCMKYLDESNDNLEVSSISTAWQRGYERHIHHPTESGEKNKKENHENSIIIIKPRVHFLLLFHLSTQKNIVVYYGWTGGSDKNFDRSASLF